MVKINFIHFSPDLSNFLQFKPILSAGEDFLNFIRIICQPWFKTIYSHIFQEYITKSGGFLTLLMWLLSGLLMVILQAILGPFPTDMLLLTILAFTPAIWIGKNNEIIQNFMSNSSGTEDGEPSNNIEENFGGIWIGHWNVKERHAHMSTPLSNEWMFDKSSLCLWLLHSDCRCRLLVFCLISGQEEGGGSR